MSLIDMYRNNMTRKLDESARLSADKAKEQAKIPPLQAKIISAQKILSRKPSESTVKSKQREIEQAQKSLASIAKTIADIDKKIATKNREYANEEKKYRQEEYKINRQRVQEEKKRFQENALQMKTINQSLQRQDSMQQHLSAEIEILKHVPEKITVLFFATNPQNTDRLRLDEEVRSIHEMIRKSEHRDAILLESRWAVRPLDILQAINELNPDVIHFSGHGAETSELVLENTDGSAKFVTKEAITQTIMSASDKIHLIFFNTCFSHEQAQSVTEHVDAAVGMTDSISDVGACIFAAQFYSALGFGLSLKKAFEQAKGILMTENSSERDTPALFVKKGIDPENMFIVKPKDGK